MGAGASAGASAAVRAASAGELQSLLADLPPESKAKLSAALAAAAPEEDGLGAAAPEAPAVETKLGRVSGRAEGGLAKFIGVPYARPPTLENGLRFKPPQPLEAWSGDKACVDMPPRAYQPKPLSTEPSGSEDCLYLAVVTRPSWIGASELKPVLFWIHGGSNTQGALGDYGELAGPVTIDHDVVQVSVQYRLGCFGWLCHEDLAVADGPFKGCAGNWGIMDQIAALEWVQQNIRAFGGDPGNVTIAGESAGGLDVDVLCDASSPAKGLFHKSVSMSGHTILAGMNDVQSMEKRLEDWRSTGVTSDMLRSSSTADLCAACMKGPGEKACGPAADSVVCSARLPTGMRDDLPSIHGGCLEESNLFELFGMHIFGKKVEGEEMAKEANKELALQVGIAEDEFEQMWGLYSKEQVMDNHFLDDMWLASNLFKARRQAAAKKAPSFCYVYEKEIRQGIKGMPDGMGGLLQGAHCLDSFALFKWNSWMLPVAKPLPAEAEKTVATIRSHIASFAATGQPESQGVAWDRYDGDLAGAQNIMKYMKGGLSGMKAVGDTVRDGSKVSTLEKLCKLMEARMMGESPGGGL